VEALELIKQLKTKLPLRMTQKPQQVASLFSLPSLLINKINVLAHFSFVM